MAEWTIDPAQAWDEGRRAAEQCYKAVIRQHPTPAPINPYRKEEPAMPDNSIKYPKVKVKLVGEDSGAFQIIGRVGLALKRAGVPETEVQKFHEEATSGDYDNLLRTCMKWVSVR